MKLRVWCAVFVVGFVTGWAGAQEASSRCGWCSVNILAPKTGVAKAGATDFFWTQGEAETNKIDVLLVFDKTAKAWVLSHDYLDCEDFANEAVLELNAGLANTGLDEYFTFRLAGVKVAGVSFNKYTAPRLAYKVGTMQGLTSNESSVLRRIRDARDEVKADLVALISDGFAGDASGSGMMFSSYYWNESGVKDYKDMAYCAVSISAIQERYTLLHEFGHLMGAGHPDKVIPALDPGPQIFDYSAGYYFTAGGMRYATVMSNEWDGYDDVIAVRMPFFSSPAYSMLVTNESGELVDSGVPVGTSKNDNTRTLRQTYPIVANFRVARQLDTMPEDPRKISISAHTPNEVLDDGSELPARIGVTARVKVSAPSATMMEVAGLPPGLAFDGAKGLIYGVPTRTGSYEVTVTARNAAYSSAFRFKIAVAPLPGWAVGTYYGWSAWEGVYVPVKVVTTQAGKIKGAFAVSGKNIFFTSTRYLDDADDDRGETALTANVKVKVSNSDMRILTLNLERADFLDRSGVMLACGKMSFSGVASEVLEDLWGEGEISRAEISKRRIVSVTADTPGETGLRAGDEMKFMLTQGGSGKFQGRISGVRVSGTARFARLGAEVGSDFVELAQMPVIVKPTGSSALARGYAAIARFRFAVNGETGKVVGLKLTSLDVLPGVGSAP